MTSDEIVYQIDRLKRMNDDLRGSISFFSESGMWFETNGLDTKPAMIEKWRDIIRKNEMLIAGYEDLLKDAR